MNIEFFPTFYSIVDKSIFEFEFEIEICMIWLSEFYREIFF